MFHHWLVLATILFLRSQAHPQWLSNRDLCDTLDIRHGIVAPEDQLSSDSVQIRLTNNGEDSNCYKPGIYYNVTIRSNSMPIYGLLFLQPKDKTIGTFPYVEKNRNGDKRRVLRDGLTDRFCSGKAISHRCLYTDKRDYRTTCNLGMTLELPFLAPEDRDNTVHFRYSIVFEAKKFLENKEVTFPACPCAEGECKEKKVCDASEFRFRETTEKALTPCPKRRSSHTEVRHVVENGINYTCTAIIRMKVCSTGCEREGGTLCCRVVLKQKMRNFECIHSSSGAKISKRMEVMEGKKCECFLCKEVCPVVPPMGNSVEVEHDAETDNDVDTSNDVDAPSDAAVTPSTTSSSTGAAEEVPTRTNTNTEEQGSTSNEGGVQRYTTSSETILDSV